MLKASWEMEITKTTKKKKKKEISHLTIRNYTSFTEKLQWLRHDFGAEQFCKRKTDLVVPLTFSFLQMAEEFMVYESLVVHSSNSTRSTRKKSAGNWLFSCGKKCFLAQVSQYATWCLLQQPPQRNGLIRDSLLVLLSLHKPTPTHLTHTKALLN